MAFRIFLDTDVLLDFAIKKDRTARQLMEWAIKGRVQAFITNYTVQVAGYALVKVYGTAKAKELLSTLLVDVQIIDIAHAITVDALHSRIGDMDLAMQYYTAMHHKLDYFITRAGGLGEASSPVLPVCSPEIFIQNNS
jgi:predicted nucleic acid-binding protein